MSNDCPLVSVVLPAHQWMCVVRALENCAGYPSAAEQQAVSNARDMILSFISISPKGAE